MSLVLGASHPESKPPRGSSGIGLQIDPPVHEVRHGSVAAQDSLQTEKRENNGGVQFGSIGLGQGRTVPHQIQTKRIGTVHLRVANSEKTCHVHGPSGTEKEACHFFGLHKVRKCAGMQVTRLGSN